MDSPRREQPPTPQPDTKPSRIRALYSKDPLEEISIITGYQEGYLPMPSKLKLGPIDQFELAKQYFGIAQELIGDKHLFTTAKSLVKKYHHK